jgi:EAL domain-containing protein (putative c-di-GMP-specific phosphodiesterase class I)
MEELKKLGCFIGQGHYFSPPISLLDAEEFLLKNRKFLQA